MIHLHINKATFSLNDRTNTQGSLAWDQISMYWYACRVQVKKSECTRFWYFYIKRMVKYVGTKNFARITANFGILDSD